ncbi:nuclear GTPase SLIP-GC-like [Astatotilapia calliptera]|uniref:nuclear GTPase SLIP-GC-like n=1 Tax=Astatotilapia calliptera TaxID=8154 RepID=UPI000E402277|nr:nuclear GTPase SLIP-GC-like [Astatotilapia calliptera]
MGYICISVDHICITLVPGSYLLGFFSVSLTETEILSDVKDIMRRVSERLHGRDKLSAFLKDQIKDLETEKRHLVGVFGKTGAGKSALINAIINKEGLLPSGSVSACTSVMIKVEATNGSKYEAHIEFITKEDWENEVQSLKLALEEDNDDDGGGGNDDCLDPDGKLSALYGEEWKERSTHSLMDNKYFRDIPEFLKPKIKILESDSAEKLSEELLKYTKYVPKQEDGYKAQQWFWPLVKCVTVRVPNNKFLQHVTLVDLPGNGNCNKSRNEMWRQIVGDCSTVWIVAEITRAASENEAWEILKSAHGLIGNGGQCEQIHFICTKSDPSDNRDIKNKEAKKEVTSEFRELNESLSEHFSEDCFKVFTVSAEEFLKRKGVKEDANEIAKLQDFLQNCNDCHSETCNYVTGAYGILSLIEGARRRKEGVGKADDVCKVLEKNMREQLNTVKTAVEEATKDFEQCLAEGIKNFITSEKKLKTFLDREDLCFSTLQAVVKRDGIHTTKRGEQIDLNMMLASCLTDSIDKKFRETFPNDIKCGSFKGVISRFSLGTNSLIQKYNDVELQLIFLQTQEDKMKAQMEKFILKQKNKIYTSLTETVKENMTKCYIEAKKIEKTGAVNNMRETIERHVHSNKNMFERAKNTMLEKLNALMQYILETLQKTMMESIELSLKTLT